MLRGSLLKEEKPPFGDSIRAYKGRPFPPLLLPGSPNCAAEWTEGEGGGEEKD